jgi:predicted dienelactone hydrolase
MLVGYMEGLAFDEQRPNWDGDGPRPLKWTAWYPAAEGVPEQRTAPPFWFEEAPVVREAPLLLLAGAYPLVLLSLGTGGVAAGLAWLGHRLAQRGFVVLAVNHHGNTGNEPYRAEGFVCLWERARDLSALLDQTDWRQRLGGRLKPWAYIAGFSAGAYAAMLLMGARVAYSQFEPANPVKSPLRGPREFPNLADEIPVLLERSAVFRQSWARRSDNYADGRFGAALALAPGRSVLGFAAESLTRINRPVQMIVGDADTIAPAATCAGWLHSRVPGSRLAILGTGVGHYAFLPEPTPFGRQEAPDIFVDAAGVDRRAIHDQVAASAISTFGEAP